MTKSLPEVLKQLADHASSLNEKVLSHILRMGVLEARKSNVLPPLPILGIWDWDLTSDLAYLDPICAEMFGVEARKGVPSSSWIKAIHPDDIPLVSREIQSTMKRGGDYQFEYRLIINDRVRWVLSKGYCTLDQSKRPERFPGAIHEISAEHVSRALTN